MDGVEHTFLLNSATVLADVWTENGTNYAIYYTYDETGLPFSMEYTDGTNSVLLYYITNLSGDVVALCTPEGDIAATYSYSAWGHTTVTLGNGTGITEAVRTASGLNPFRYRSYYYDAETEFYYCNSRCYDPLMYRWLNADGYASTGQGILGHNMFIYCGNDPVNRTDISGEAWWHWALGAVVVAACAVAVVATAGGAAAGIAAVVAVANGVAATTTATTIAAGAFVGAATAYGTAALVAITNSTSVEDFNEQGNWGTVTGTALGAVTGGLYGYDMANAQLSSPQQSKHTSETFLPDEYYAKNKAPNISTPNSSYITCKYNAHTGEYEKSTAYYDFAGRQTLRIDWTNHGYADHGNPHVHYTIYSKQFPNGTSIRWD